MPESTIKTRASVYFRRFKHKLLRCRRFIPGLSQRNYLESLVGPLGYWDKLQQFQLDFLQNQGLQPHHTLLDVGCGPLQGGVGFIHFLNSGNYVGIDLRPESISAGYTLLARHGLSEKNPLLIVSKTFGQKELGPRKFDYIWASQILYHLEPPIMRQFFEQAAARMTPSTKLYGNVIHDPSLYQGKRHWEEFPYVPHTIDSLKSLANEFGLELKVLGHMHEFGYPCPDRALRMFYMLEIRCCSGG